MCKFCHLNACAVIIHACCTLFCSLVWAVAGQNKFQNFPYPVDADAWCEGAFTHALHFFPPKFEWKIFWIGTGFRHHLRITHTSKALVCFCFENIITRAKRTRTSCARFNQILAIHTHIHTLTTLLSSHSVYNLAGYWVHTLYRNGRSVTYLQRENKTGNYSQCELFTPTFTLIFQKTKWNDVNHTLFTPILHKYSHLRSHFPVPFLCLHTTFCKIVQSWSQKPSDSLHAK